jgi:hypothetical protein
LSQSQKLREARIGLNLIDGCRLSVRSIVAPIMKDLQASFKWAPKRLWQARAYAPCDTSSASAAVVHFQDPALVFGFAYCDSEQDGLCGRACHHTRGEIISVAMATDCFIRTLQEAWTKFRDEGGKKLRHAARVTTGPSLPVGQPSRTNLGDWVTITAKHAATYASPAHSSDLPGSKHANPA